MKENLISIEKDQTFIKTYTYVEKDQELEVEKGTLVIKGSFLEYELGLRKIKKYINFEDEDDVLHLDLKIADNEGQIWNRKLTITGYDIWRIDPIDKHYKTRKKNKNLLLVDSLKGIIDTRVINKVVVDNSINEIYEKYLEYEIAVEYSIEEFAERNKIIENIFTVHFNFKSEYQKINKEFSCKIFIDKILDESILSKSHSWKYIGKGELQNLAVIFNGK